MAESANFSTVFSGATKRYRVTSRIGAGSVTEVLAAEVEGTGEEVALKVLRESFSLDGDARAAFEREARAAATISHPNVARIDEVASSHRGPFIAMERLRGKTFGALLSRSSAMPGPVVLRVFIDALAGVEAAHARGIVHGDLSPGSIFVSDDGSVKVADFGLAKSVGIAADTRTGILRGKVAYLAPEQVSEAPIDARTDVRALGVVMWEALTRASAWGKGGDVVILTRIATEELKSPQTVDATIPDAIAAVCVKATRRDPAERYPSAIEFRAALSAILDPLGDQGSNESLARIAVAPPSLKQRVNPRTDITSASKSSRVWIVLAIVAVAVAAVTICLVAFGH